MHDHKAILEKMSAIENELKALELWGGQENIPSVEALSSQSPFCIDTLEFHAWLEYVLISRLRSMIESGQPLPQAMQVHTYAEEHYRGRWGEYRALIGLLRELDSLITIAK